MKRLASDGCSVDELETPDEIPVLAELADRTPHLYLMFNGS